MATGENILLGYGVVSINNIPFGLTRGGSVFVTEREIRNIEADGDKGPVKNRINIDSEIPKLTVRGLETFSALDVKKYYPGLSVTPGAGVTPTTDIVTGTLVIAPGDYVDVKWEGKKKNGKPVTIIVKNALNLENLEWALEDKNEVIAELVYTGTYLEASRETPPWEIIYGR